MVPLKYLGGCSKNASTRSMSRTIPERLFKFDDVQRVRYWALIMPSLWKNMNA